MSEQKRLPLYEPFSISTAFVDEIAGVIPSGSVTHLVFASSQPNANGEMERLVQARLIVPTERLQAIGKAILQGHMDQLGNDQFEPLRLQ